MNNISSDIIKLFEMLKFNVSKIASVSSLWKNKGEVIINDPFKK